MTSNYPPQQSEDPQFGNSMSNGGHSDAPPLPYAPPEPSKSSKKGCGCWVAGCLGGLFVGALLIAGAGFGGYWWFTQQVEKYTDAEPNRMPAVEMEEEEVTALQKQVDSFFKQVMPDRDKTTETDSDATPPIELVLTAEQINALMQSSEMIDGRAFVEINDGRILAKISIPTDQFPGGAGRHFNADAEIEVSLEAGVLVIQIVEAKVKGESLPEEFIAELSKQNLAKELYDDVDTAKILRRFESIEVVDDTVRMRLKQPAKQVSNEDLPPKTTRDETTGMPSAEAEIPAERSDKPELLEQAP